MAAQPNKHWCTGLQKSISSGYTHFDPKLTISGQPVKYLDDADFRYLGRPTNIYNSEFRCRNDIKTSLLQWFSLVDQLALHTPGKLWLYQHFIVAKMVWFFFHCPRSLSLSLSRLCDNYKHKQTSFWKDGLDFLNQPVQPYFSQGDLSEQDLK